MKYAYSPAIYNPSRKYLRKAKKNQGEIPLPSAPAPAPAPAPMPVYAAPPPAYYAPPPSSKVPTYVWVGGAAVAAAAIGGAVWFFLLRDTGEEEEEEETWTETESASSTGDTALEDAAVASAPSESVSMATASKGSGARKDTKALVAEGLRKAGVPDQSFTMKVAGEDKNSNQKSCRAELASGERYYFEVDLDKQTCKQTKKGSKKSESGSSKKGEGKKGGGKKSGPTEADCAKYGKGSTAYYSCLEGKPL